MTAEIDGARFLQDLDDLARIGATPEGGVHRVAFSPADQEGRAWVERAMTDVGLEVRRDAAGNTVGAFPGSEPGLAPIALGSHTDTVPNGGRYDGALGVLAALACARALRESGARLRHPLEVINFASEEAALGGGTFGSRAMSGQFDPASLGQLAWDGRTLADHLRGAGIDPDAVVDARRAPDSLAAYVELHIEQSGQLEAGGIQIGVVEGIVGIRRYEATFEGEANHAGTTPMEVRRDALVAAAPFIPAIRELAIEYGIVGTAGSLQVSPGASNVIPGRVDLSVELRGLDDALLDRAEAALVRRAEAFGGRCLRISNKEPIASSAVILNAIESSCTRLGLTQRRMPSGAGHDAMCAVAIAKHGMGMIFAPSHKGISHAPQEYTSPDDCLAGARVLLRTLLALDERLDAS